ncbi:ABC transporter ATP-binding protein [Sporolactobacillus pectinivorans]|uniref:ABC transporter ATP-binding protein n=1 Tax=Sporolactobacillus pectinivorans TaxID=1591408 RepID=UPI000C25C472|nr:ABC transporter ATP-binding protein [Sporolactobacillus pectinivorans]
MLLSVDINEAGYAADSPVLRDVHFSVDTGELVGLIGPNGAGKSTTIKSILGIMKNVKGDCQLGNYAYIPERPILYEKLTLWEHIEFLLTTLDTDEKSYIDRTNTLLERFQLTRVIHQYPESFSKGMQQKVMLVLAFLKQPDLYIVDEPFMGLDPKAVKRLLQSLQKEKEQGAGILMSTHVLDTAEKICDRFVLISNGRLIVQGALDEIRKYSGLSTGSLLDCFDVLTEDESDVRD